LYGKGERTENAHFANGRHDYGYEKRQPVYRFMAKWLGLNDDPARMDESTVKVLPLEELRIQIEQ
jgi:hypothetical protein